MADAPPEPFVLAYAPPVRNSVRQLLFIPFGLFTTALSLTGVYFVSRSADANVMGWFFYFVIPLGAILAGAAAGFGYLVAGQIGGVRARRHTFVLLIVIQTLAYFGASYVEFRVKGPYYDVKTFKEVGFWRYYHVNATSMRWVSREHPDGERLGGSGYFFKALELVGFVGAGVVWLALLRGGDYCELCYRYRASKPLVWIPASAPYPTELNDDTRAAFEERSAEVMERAEEQLERLDRLAAEGDAEGFLAELERVRAEGKGAEKLPTRIRMELSYCAGCHDGVLVQAVKSGQQVESTTEMLPSIPLSRDFVAAVVRKKAPEVAEA